MTKTNAELWHWRQQLKVTPSPARVAFRVADEVTRMSRHRRWPAVSREKTRQTKRTQIMGLIRGMGCLSRNIVSPFKAASCRKTRLNWRTVQARSGKRHPHPHSQPIHTWNTAHAPDEPYTLVPTMHTIWTCSMGALSHTHYRHTVPQQCPMACNVCGTSY